MLSWLQKMLLEKWAGRAIGFLLVYLSAYLSKYFPADAVANFLGALSVLLQMAVPLILAWILGMARQKTALLTPSPAQGEGKSVNWEKYNG